MNKDKLTTIDDEILDNVSGGSIVEGVGLIIQGSMEVVDSIVDDHIKAHQKFWENLANLRDKL